MTSITFIDPIQGVHRQLDFAQLVTLIKGSAIKSMALGDDFLELGLSDAFNLRIQGTDILLMSTLNNGELPPVRVQILDEGEAATAEVVESRIHAFRQLYASTYLVAAGRAEEVARVWKENPEADLERELLNEEERLFVTAASEG
jgi:hypothetical protein